MTTIEFVYTREGERGRETVELPVDLGGADRVSGREAIAIFKDYCQAEGLKAKLLKATLHREYEVRREEQ